MKRFPFPLLVLLALTLSPLVQAKETPAPPHYIEPAKVDYKALLSPPPAVGSVEAQKEIGILLEHQKTRTQAEVDRAKSEVKLKVFIFADVVGPWFTEKNLPVTAAFFKDVTEDTKVVTEAAKKYFARPRPWLQDKQIKPAIDLENNASYPSGHATRGLLFALILAEMAPDLKEQLIARGELIGTDRVIGGVHFPSDVAAGQLLARALDTDFMASPTFQAALAKAKVEFEAARGKK